jgi:putative DNA primase/helicase
LGVTRRADRVLAHCFAGCKQDEVFAALGLKRADLFAGLRVVQPPSTIVATYDYVDAVTGEVLATKVRYAPKAFGWRGANGRWGLHGRTPGLYRLADVIDGGRQVLITEGEKACDRLWPLGLAAVCTPAGASTWRVEWSVDLWRAGVQELVVLPDADRPGQRHAERVASISFGVGLSQALKFAPVAADVDAPWSDWPEAVATDPEVAPLTVKVIALPGLPAGGDVVDWLDAGHTADELRALIASTPSWTPGGTERDRLARRRQMTRDRVRRLRERRRQLSAVEVAHAA